MSDATTTQDTSIPMDPVTAMVEVRIYHLGPGQFHMGMCNPVVPRFEAMARTVKVWGGHLHLRLHPEHNKKVPTSPPQFLEMLWRDIERGGEDCVVPRLATDPAAIRSFVVGDVVVLGTPGVDAQYWVCDTFGWTQLQI